MKISIITSCLNAKKTINDTIKSVLGQSYPDIEYIIIDGYSTDGTVDVIGCYKDKISKFISEPDNGIYDGMNKGLKIATGDIIGFLNSDDVYTDKNIIKEIAEKFETGNPDSIYGNIMYVDRKGKITRYWNPGKFSKDKFEKGWHPPHPAFFVKRLVYEKYGVFNENFKISADYEIMLRFLYKYDISTSYINKTLVKMQKGGVSNKNIRNIMRANVECYKAWKTNGLKINKCIFFLKPLSKLKQIRVCG